MSGVEALSFEEVECGKKVAESKKRFKWKFSINHRSYCLELAVSTLSGKRIVSLNSVEIYSEQSILNINFDYSHVIEGHVLRITRVPDSINKFEMRIDNRDFEQIKASGYGAQQQEAPSQYKKVQYDPFADFGSVAKPTNPQGNNSDFGAFDFDAFSPTAVPTMKAQRSQPVQAKVASNFDNFDFDGTSKGPSAANYQTVKFQTNNFQTNNNGGAPNAFFQNFNKFDKQFDENDFATNTFGKNNHYSDLVHQKPYEKSDWSDFEEKAPEEKEKEKGFFGDAFKMEMSGKQAMNKIKMTATQLKMKITGQDESLI